MLLRTTTSMACLLGLLTLAACDETTTEPPVDPVIWTAELAGEGEAELAGAISVESTATQYTASIELEGAADGAEYAWYVGAGPACGDVEDRIGDAGDYPVLEADEEGLAAGEATVAGALDPEVEYHVAVLSSDEEATVLACGELVAED